jgi:hypothetical protein
MNKNQKVLLGVAVVGVAGYFYWKSKQPKVAFVKAGLAGNAKAGFLAGKVAPMGSNGSFKKGFLAGNVAPVGSDSFGKKAGFVKAGWAGQQKTSGDAVFAKAEGMDKTARNIPTETVGTSANNNPFFKVKGAHVGTPALWK